MDRLSNTSASLSIARLLDAASLGLDEAEDLVRGHLVSLRAVMVVPISALSGPKNQGLLGHYEVSSITVACSCYFLDHLP